MAMIDSSRQRAIMNGDSRRLFCGIKYPPCIFIDYENDRRQHVGIGTQISRQIQSRGHSEASEEPCKNPDRPKSEAP